MTSEAVPQAATSTGGTESVFPTIVALAWRNLWRNRRRTWLTIGGIAFAVWFLVFARSMQSGTFDVMIDNGARMLVGHVQVQHPRYEEDPRVDYTIEVDEILPLLQADPDVDFVSARAQGFALVSVGERSFGGQIIGVDPRVEAEWSGLKGLLDRGRYPMARGEAMIGSLLAKNLHIDVGDEFVVLGTAKAGGIAPLAAQVVGVFHAAQPELNRSLVKVHIDDFREAWDFAPHEAHALVVLSSGPAESERVVARLKNHVQDYRVLGWQDLMREARQMRDMKTGSTQIFFVVIAIIVAFSVVNTFMMVVFERTQELGVLMAIGMRPALLHLQLQLEALFVAGLGVLAGFALAGGIMLIVADTGIPIPVEGMEDMIARFNMETHLYPTFDWDGLIFASILMPLCVQIAALIPALRLYRMRPVDAIRQEA